ncbi:MAG: ferrochelatase [Pseudomonadales bacterium]
MSFKRAILLVNLGTPDQPTASAVRKFLARFLSDSRVVEIPKIIWQFILRCIILPLRCRRVAKQYQSIWLKDGSPLAVITRSQAESLAQRISSAAQPSTAVFYAMTYGKPSIQETLDKIVTEGNDSVTVLPLYPQYSATTTAAVFDQIANHFQRRRLLPELRFIRDYHDNPVYISALAASIREFRRDNGAADVLLMSFHGIPAINIEKGDPYRAQCEKTAKLLADALDLSNDAWQISFQSRFGRTEWIKPYTTDIVLDLAAAKKSIDVVCPAFSADCLETLYEIQLEIREQYLAAGGTAFNYIPCLNDRDDHIELMQILGNIA